MKIKIDNLLIKTRKGTEKEVKFTIIMLTKHLTTTGLEDEHLKLFKTQLLIIT